MYEKIHSTRIALEKDIMKCLAETHIKKTELKKFPAWKINNAPILELSRLFKINYNIIINLGLSRGIRYNLIKHEKINPSSVITQEQYTARNLHLYGYYLYVVRKYYLIKNYNSIQHIPYDLKSIMINNTLDIYNILPNLDNDIIIQYAYYKIHETPVHISNFLLYSISNTILYMHALLKKAQFINTHKLLMYVINGIINTEQLFSEPETTIFVVPNAKNIAMVDYNTLDNNTDLYNGYESPTESIGNLSDLGDDDQIDQFSVDDLDMEMGDEENFEMHHDM